MFLNGQKAFRRSDLYVDSLLALIQFSVSLRGVCFRETGVQYFVFHRDPMNAQRHQNEQDDDE
jgi:hypothetical protein